MLALITEVKVDVMVLVIGNVVVTVVVVDGVGIDKHEQPDEMKEGSKVVIDAGAEIRVYLSRLSITMALLVGASVVAGTRFANFGGVVVLIQPILVVGVDVIVDV